MIIKLKTALMATALVLPAITGSAIADTKILAFVRAMLEDTRIVILDEPSEGVQPEKIQKMQECIEFRKSKGTAFVLVEQNLAMLTAISDLYLGIESGKVVFSGDKATTTRDNILNVLSV